MENHVIAPPLGVSPRMVTFYRRSPGIFAAFLAALRRHLRLLLLANCRISEVLCKLFKDFSTQDSIHLASESQVCPAHQIAWAARRNGNRQGSIVSIDLP